MNIANLRPHLRQSSERLSRVETFLSLPHVHYTLLIAEQQMTIGPNIYIGNEQDLVLDCGDAILCGAMITGLDKDLLTKNLLYIRIDARRIMINHQFEGENITCYPNISTEWNLKIWDELREAEQSELLEVSAFARNLSKNILLRISHPSWKEEDFQDRIYRETGELLSWRMRNMKRRVSQHELSQRSGISFQQINKRVLRFRGHSLHRELVQQRITAAMSLCHLPKNTKWSATEIALECGFSNLSAMNRSFLHEVGFRLQEYRKALKKKQLLLQLFYRLETTECETIDASTFYQYEQAAQIADNTFIIHICNSTDTMAELLWLNDEQEVTFICLIPPQSLNFINSSPLHHLQIKTGSKLNHYRVTQDSRRIVIE